MIMLSNVKNYICENIDELLSIKTAYLIFVTAMMIVFAIGCIYLMDRHNTDIQYILPHIIHNKSCDRHDASISNRIIINLSSQDE